MTEKEFVAGLRRLAVEAGGTWSGPVKDIGMALGLKASPMQIADRITRAAHRDGPMAEAGVAVRFVDVWTGDPQRLRTRRLVQIWHLTAAEPGQGGFSA